MQRAAQEQGHGFTEWELQDICRRLQMTLKFWERETTIGKLSEGTLTTMDFWLEEKGKNDYLCSMKITKELKKRKIPIVRIDKSLNKYDNIVLFPDKLEKANEMLRKAGIPKQWTGKHR